MNLTAACLKKFQGTNTTGVYEPITPSQELPLPQRLHKTHTRFDTTMESPSSSSLPSAHDENENVLSGEPTTEQASTNSQTELDYLNPLNDEDVKNCLEDADQLKLEGNDHFRRKESEEALVKYRAGLGRLPKPRKDKQPDEDEEEDDDVKKVSPTIESESQIPVKQTELERICAKARAVLNANIGACYVQLDDHKAAVAACTEALRDDPVYIKALQRRAKSNEILNTWSSLASSQEDYKKLLDLLPPNSSQSFDVKRSLRTLEPRVAEAQKRETGEMLDKLKGLGNSILGNFGLSTDNFKFTQNEQGGYSMNFVQNQ
ncbi:Tetratricopeptide repeat domain-containing protein [Abortiporus biennis]